MKYIKQLDSVRAIAVLLVIVSHWMSGNYFVSKVPLGAIGVDIFFVLSGFLISRILFDNRNKAEKWNIPATTLLKNFYVRRTLRIFPIYYLVIFLLLLFSESTGTHIRDAFWYFATYTSNFYFFHIQGWDGILSHLWSLAVEEQFYLIWPWILLFANRKYFPYIIAGFILIGVSSQYALAEVKLSTILTFTCFDAFGLGALLAWVLVYAEGKLKMLFRWLTVLGVLSVLLFCLCLIKDTWYVPLRTLASLITLWLINYILLYRETNSMAFKLVLNNRLLIFLGKISYGLYLYHNIIPQTLNLKIINPYLNPLLPDFLYKKHWELLFFFENAILVVCVSWLSFVFIEKKFLNLKKYFELEHEKNSRNRQSLP